MIVSPRQMGKTSYYMMLQIDGIHRQLLKNPDSKITVASMYKQYFEGLIKFAESMGAELKMTIPEDKGNGMWWSQVVSFKLKAEAKRVERN